jgi:hypothetical protein
MRLALCIALLGMPVLASAATGDWQIQANSAWIGRADVNVSVWLTAPGLTGPNVAPATQMLGPFTASELRAIPAGSLAGTGQSVCAHAFAYTGTNSATPTTRSVEVSNCQSFPLGPPVLSIAP